MTVPTLTLSIAALRAAGACDLDERIADLRAVRPDVADDEPVPLAVWWALATTSIRDRWWSLRVAQPLLTARQVAVRGASRAASRAAAYSAAGDASAASRAAASAASRVASRATAYAAAGDAYAAAVDAAYAAEAAVDAAAAAAVDAYAYAYAAAAERSAQSSDLDRLLMETSR